VQRAIQIARSRAAEYGIAGDRIGVCGFSAGGHLASTAATHFDASSRPDFAILTYPVITFTDEANVHKGSRAALLGENPDPALVQSLSNELQVSPRTPPTFLVHSNEDRGVPPENSVLFYLALRRAGVPAEMHIYERAPTDSVLAHLTRCSRRGRHAWPTGFERADCWMRMAAEIDSSERPLADARGSVESIRNRAATVRERFLP